MANRLLSQLRPLEKGKIVKVAGNGSIHRRILDMGLVPGSEVEVERVAPLGDPLAIKVKGYRLSLRKEEAANIHVEVAEEEAIPLAVAVPGKTYKVVGVKAGWGLRWRLNSMGVVPGARICIASAKHGRGMLVEVNGSIVSLGQGMAQKVLVAESQ